MEKEKKVMEESAIEKDSLLQKKIKTVGNYVHDSVPISSSEVGYLVYATAYRLTLDTLGQQRVNSQLGAQRNFS